MKNIGEKTSTALKRTGTKIKETGTAIKESETLKNVGTKISSAAANIKVSFSGKVPEMCYAQVHDCIVAYYFSQNVLCEFVTKYKCLV